jgi:DMSO reductase family type II enzyme chaperone
MMQTSLPATSARETLWRLGAAALGHPIEPLYDSFASGVFHEAFDAASVEALEQEWRAPALSADFETFEAGYIANFVHGARGPARAPLHAGDYEALLAGQARPQFMLNVSAFYRHFGLKAAVEDEGRADEPDHIACMMEFMAVLAHLEAGALGAGRDESGYRRAQRDFLKRYLAPLLGEIVGRLRSRRGPALDATLAGLLDRLHAFAAQEIERLDADVSFDAAGADSRQTRRHSQDLWA